jgi:hypothetical protein
MVIEWKRGPEKFTSNVLQMVANPFEATPINQTFEKVSKFYYNGKRQVDEKMCEFKVMTIVKKKKVQLSQKVFNMASKINKSDPFDLDLGRGITLKLQFEFKMPHDTSTIDGADSDEEEKNIPRNESNPYGERDVSMGSDSQSPQKKED